MIIQGITFQPPSLPWALTYNSITKFPPCDLAPALLIRNDNRVPAVTVTWVLSHPVAFLWLRFNSLMSHWLKNVGGFLHVSWHMAVSGETASKIGLELSPLVSVLVCWGRHAVRTAVVGGTRFHPGE